MKLPIYLDYAATTPVDLQVINIMNKYLSITGNFGNPASRSHKFGWIAEEAVDIARNQISDLIKADPREIIFTSGATESNNLALKGFLDFYKSKNHIITSKTEHKSILDTCQYLEKKGFKVTYLTPKKTGLIDLNELEDTISKNTALISIMYVNNEIGIIQNIFEISNICKKKNVILHVDATQAIGKISINLKKLKIDLMSFSAHKIYGPKGIGALYVRRKPRVRLISQIHGGGHERGMRSGTLPVHQIAGFGLACSLAGKNLKDDNIHCMNLRDQLWNGIKKIEEVYLNTDLKNSSPHILNVSFNYVEGESLIMALKDLAVSSGSACTSSSLKPSYVLRSIGVKDELAHSSIRFSIGKYTSNKEIEYSLNLIHLAIKKLRILSPLWEMYKEGIDINEVQWNT